MADDPIPQGQYQVDCWHCGGEGYLDGCICEAFVDICDCAEPEPPKCPECRGKGWNYVTQLTEDNCDTAIPVQEDADGNP